MIPNPETTLISLAQSGDREAFAELTRLHATSLRGYLISNLRNEHDANDLLQNVLVKIWKALPRYEDRGRIRAWMLRIARNELLNFVRSQKRIRSTPLDEIQWSKIEGREPAADQQLLERERREWLIESIDKLPEAQRQVVYLRLNEEITFREIAERTRTPINTVLWRMHSATRRLRDSMMLEMAA
ncbi:MAG: RNA polymerase sigma-70 factor (ECF subfamily) [Verrucomicrobiales bacterium]|jgi:RNA polymerase sigma-70 factor (ECF subfamily)